MANLKDIRRRIQSVQNTQKITRAMKMVSAAKLRRAQEAATNFRDYADLSAAILKEVAGDAENAVHPLLEAREEKASLVLVISSDRGLCGAFNGNLCRALEAHIQAREVTPELAIIGRKAHDYFLRREVTIHSRYPDVYDDPGYGTAQEIAAKLSELFVSGTMDRIELAFNSFESVMRQEPTFKPLLPIVLEETDGDTDSADGKQETAGPVGYTFEPDAVSLLATLLPKYVEVQIYRALLESIAAEHAARMTAMDAATNNAGDMIDHLTLQYNRARQDAITKELMDIVGGAEALSE
jgi:F-type H+-transporting ATPase subunit gamma